MHQEKIRLLLADVDEHSIHPVRDMQKRLDAYGINIELGGTWRVTPAFLQQVKANGGWLNIPVGTKVVGGHGVLLAVMAHYKVFNPKSFGAQGWKFRADWELLMAKAKQLDEELARAQTLKLPPVSAETAAHLAKFDGL